MYGCMQGLFRVVWCWCGVYISMYNALVAGVVVCGAGGLFVCMDSIDYIQWFILLVFALMCIYRMIYYIQNSNNFHA